ncbi:hypothetical protein CJ030_MR2G007117 [Morella rubra]|uniref:DUF7733 domain-containing protein n=1 Tax=Morella rubra TaxID=262757 RepID=A0A6A1WP07_9ROSI|nr:hypothetical protein CJ030_MR2G007117 [Morella rubra]
MSGITLAVAPRTDPDEASTAATNPPQQKPSHHHQHQQQTVMGGLMGSLRVIELQLVAFILVFSASGLVPLIDLVFPAFTSVYLLALASLGIPFPW